MEQRHRRRTHSPQQSQCRWPPELSVIFDKARDGGIVWVGDVLYSPGSFGKCGHIGILATNRNALGSPQMCGERSPRPSHAGLSRTVVTGDLYEPGIFELVLVFDAASNGEVAGAGDIDHSDAVILTARHMSVVPSDGNRLR